MSGGRNADRHNILKKMFSIYQGSKEVFKQVLPEGNAKKKQPPSGLKYGVHQSVKQVRGVDSKELEEFENVSRMRPALAHIKTRELRWKDDPDVDDMLDDNSSSQPIDKTKTVDKTMDATMEGAASKTPSKQSRREVQENDMEAELKKAKETIVFLRSKLQRRDRKIAMLRSLLNKQEAELKKYRPGRISQIPHDDYDNEFPESQIKLAAEVLEKLKRNQLLENSLSREENKILTQYFTSSESYPTNDVVMLIDKAISYALDVIVNRTELCDEPIDNELRSFLIDTGNAKLVILDVMLARPEFVPDNWGGRAITKKISDKSPKSSSTSTSKSRSPSPQRSPSPKSSPVVTVRRKSRARK